MRAILVFYPPSSPNQISQVSFSIMLSVVWCNWLWPASYNILLILGAFRTKPRRVITPMSSNLDRTASTQAAPDGPKIFFLIATLSSITTTGMYGNGFPGTAILFDLGILLFYEKQWPCPLFRAATNLVNAVDLIRSGSRSPQCSRGPN
jgi:hypothetical protein